MAFMHFENSVGHESSYSVDPLDHCEDRRWDW
jgi:hypothetical protein